MVYLDVAKEIKIKRKELHSSIRKNGKDSIVTKKISIEIRKLLNKYYKKGKQYNYNSTMMVFYERSLKQLKSLTLDLGSFASTKVWNEYADKNDCLSSASMEYISGLNWNKLRTKILLEIL